MILYDMLSLIDNVKTKRTWGKYILWLRYHNKQDDKSISVIWTSEMTFLFLYKDKFKIAGKDFYIVK